MNVKQSALLIDSPSVDERITIIPVSDFDLKASINVRL